MSKIGFVGLGRMGYNMAMNLSKNYETFVWNRSKEKAENHSTKFGSNIISDVKNIPIHCNIIFFCLPTHNEVKSVISEMRENLNETHILIDCTSSDCSVQKEIYNDLIESNIYFFDAPVSGGPEKAFTGELTCMVGGNRNKFIEIESVLKTISNPIYVGDIGNGCAIKSINNILNVSHLCLASEALQSLSDLGIDKKVALEVINKSSGKSLMTEERLPIDVFEKNYNFGFSLGLMNKDVGLAMNIIKNPIMFSKINSLLKESLDKYGYDADYTEICKLYFES